MIIFRIQLRVRVCVKLLCGALTCLAWIAEIYVATCFFATTDVQS